MRERNYHLNWEPKIGGKRQQPFTGMVLKMEGELHEL